MTGERAAASTQPVTAPLPRPSGDPLADRRFAYAQALAAGGDVAAAADLMEQALELAREAIGLGEVPVGAVIVRDGKVLSQAFNLRETLNDPTAHAERLAITLAGRALGTWRLDGCTLYVSPDADEAQAERELDEFAALH